MKSSSPFHLRLFGGPSIAAEDGTPLAGPVQRHRLALLALLALAPGGGLNREKLTAYLWPERGSEHARQLLNQAVYVLRKALGEDALLSTGDELRLNPVAVRPDVADFTAALERADYERAVALYQAPFLDGFFLNDAPEFDQWAAVERTRLGDAYAKSLAALAEAAEACGAHARAVEWWKLSAAQDPYDSRVALRLMQALAANGNRAAALQHAAVHHRLLYDEFGAEPDAAIAAFADRLRSEPEPTPTRAAAPSDPVTTPTSPPLGTQALLESPALAPATRRRPGARIYSAAALLAAILLLGALWMRSAGTSGIAAVTTEPSVAVLPLAGAGVDATLAHDMTEAIITMLAKTGGLRVIGSTSVSGFRDRPADVRAIADSLRVGHIVEGGVQRSGTRLRVNVRLVDGRDGSTRWSESYDRELEDVFAVQDDIGRTVARELGVRLAGAGGRPPRPPTNSVAAYELYLRGSDLTLLRSDSAARRGIEFFRQAIALDSTYAAAWAGLARMYARVSTADSMDDRARYRELSKAAAHRAVELDDSLAEAHAVLGVVHMQDFDFATAERHLLRALELDPSRALTHQWMVSIYLWTGRPLQALTQAERSLEMDPLSPTAHAEVARALTANDRCDEALEYLDKLLHLDPPLLRVAALAAECHARDGRWQQAIEVLRPGAERGVASTSALLGYMHGRAGNRADALRIRDEVHDRWRRGTGRAMDVAIVHAGLGDRDEALRWLDLAVGDGSISSGPGWLTLLARGSLLDDLRADPRFQDVLERVGLQNR